MGSHSDSHISQKGKESKYKASVGHYMYSEYIRVVQNPAEEEKVSILSAEIYTLNVHPRRLSFLFVDIPLWSCFVLFSSFVLFCFVSFFSVQFCNSLTVCHDCHTCAFSFGCSFHFSALIFVFDHSFALLPLSVNCKFDAFIFIL